MLKQLAFAVLAFLALGGTASARALTDDDWARLEEKVIAQETALHTKDAGAVIDAFPPAILTFIAEASGGVTPEVARQQGIDTMMAAAEGASFDAYDIDYDNADGPYELADGTTYVLLPTTMVELPGDGSVTKQEVTVAVLIEDQWYLMGFDSHEELSLLLAAYPAFNTVGFVANFDATLGLPAETEAPPSEATAVALTEVQRAGIEARIETFNAAMHANDMAAVLGVVPPQMLDVLASQSGVTTEQLVILIQKAMDDALKNVTLVSFGMDLDNATVAAQPDGTPYLLIPTETVMDFGTAGGKVRATSSTLGLLDGDTWYLVRVDDPAQIAIVKELYPGLADVEFPRGNMESVTE